MCAVSRNCPLLGRNNETGGAAQALGPAIWPQRATNQQHTGILLLTHAGCRGPRDRIGVGPRSPIVSGHVPFCHTRKAETVLQRKRPFASSCDCASGILRPSAGAAMHIQQPFTPLKRPSKAAVKCETWGGRAEGDALRHLADPLAAP